MRVPPVCLVFLICVPSRPPARLHPRAGAVTAGPFGVETCTPRSVCAPLTLFERGATIAICLSG